MGGMGGQVEAIVLSPAPAEEEEAAQEGRRPDQELWRQVNHEEKNPEKRQGSDVFVRDEDKGEKGKQHAGRGAGNNVSGSGGECDSKTTETQAREDEDSREGKQKGTDRKKATEGTAKDESSGPRKRKESGSGDGKLSVEIRIHPASGKRLASSTRQTPATPSKGTSPSSRRKTSDGGPKQPKMSGENDDKLAPPKGGSQEGSPDRSGRKSPSSGRTSPGKGGRRNSGVDDKAKAKPSEAGDQAAGHDAEEGNKSKTGSGGGGEVSAPPASHPRKPPVEDRALQAILAARRRSLENAGKAEPVGGREGGGRWVKAGGCVRGCAVG
ncbi:RNA polymerase-associated protein CTR9 homolog isoform X2 [Eriocheir sinensis]|uniref:RNA polymerase-associated protein CTR9 homolog isoform X2 n=1 Tax=Eriocheir sinensis TaxID=95602 RepID=UPI0021C6BD54|nr:RNA polymerase-associated protein CTR9 homolog isoform X2 [Eriocheir sinensis]